MWTGKNTLIILGLSLFLNTLIAVLGNADEVTSQDVSKISTQIENAQKAAAPAIDCDPLGLNNAKPACSKLSDDFCSKLYDAQHDGKMRVHDGEILLGDTRAGAMKSSARANVEAILNSEKKLPADLRKKVAPIFAQVRTLLANEEDTSSWQRKLSNAMMQYSEVFTDVVNERVETRHPELKKIKLKELTVEQKSLYAHAGLDLENEIVRAKYEKNPNWQRVVRLFAQVQSDLLGEIETLNASPEFKKRLKDKLGSVKLILPYSDPRISMESSDCNKTEVNASYMPVFNKFTVCAGMFNSFQSDTSLYIIIAHELSHSIDPTTLAWDDFKVSPVGKAAKKFSGAQGPVYSCDEWNKLAQGVLNPQQKISEPQSYPYRKLTDCFFPKKQLNPFIDANVRPLTETEARNTVKGMALYKTFAALAKPTIQKKGLTVPNEFYMRPDRLWAANQGNVFPTEHSGLVPAALFVQSLSCQRATSNGKSFSYEQVPDEVKQAMYEQSILETRNVYQAVVQAQYSSCGRECPGLADVGLSRTASEHFSDWLAIRAFPKFLSRINSVENRRKAASSSMALFCDVPGPWSGSPWMEKIDQEFSLEPHPGNRSRRMSVFTESVSKAVGCERDEDVVIGDSSCDL